MPELISKDLMMDKQILLGILMGTSHPILILDKEAHIISLSQKVKDVFGYHEGDLYGKPLADIIEQSYQSSLVSILYFNNNIADGIDEDNFKFECEILDKNKNLIKAEFSLHKVVQENVVNFIVIIKDQPAKIVEIEKENEYQDLFQIQAENSSSLVIVENEVLGISYVNSKITELLGFEKEELIGKKFTELMHSDDKNLFEEAYQENKKLKIKLQDKYGNFSTFILSVQKVKPGLIDEKAIINIDKAEVDSSENAGKGLFNFAALTNILPDIFIKISRTGKVLELQTGEETDLFKNKEEVLNKTLDEVIPSPSLEIIKSAIEEAFETQKIVTCKYALPFNNGEIKHFEARIKADSEDSALTVIRNITDQVKIQQDFISANEEAIKAAKLKDDFMSVMSHEIRTPLNAVIGMTQLLIRKNPSKEQLELLNTIKFSGENLLKIINEILDFSKLKAEKVEFEEIDFNLRKLVKNNRLTHKNQASEKGLKFKLFIDDDVPEWIKGDYTKLNQILNNLISNAIKFTEEGSVCLDIYLHEQSKGQVVLLFEVSDTGIGIPKDKLEHIFDPFHQASSSTSRKFGGTGLGLSIIKNMVELQKGKIEVESEEGKGSTFRVYLRFTKAPDIIYNSSYSQNQQEISEYKIIKDFKIMYVEDVESNQLLMECLCNEWGVELEMVSNGIEAVEKVQTFRPNLVLMDLQMPGMNGYEAAEKMRSFSDDYFKELPIIALTAEVSESSKQMIREVGMNDILLKPIDTDELYEKLSRYSSLHEKKINEGQRKQMMSTVSPYNYVSFDKTEELYKNDTSGFVKLLNLLIREFEGYHVQILKAVKERDLKGISFVKHKVASTIQSFNLKELADLLVKQQHLIANEPNSMNEKDLLEECDQYFNVILNEFHNKIKEATSVTND